MPLDNITELKKRVPGGKYALTRAVAERARQLQGGATPLTEVRAPNPLSVAIDEIVQGKITFVMGDPDAQAEVEAAPVKPKRSRAKSSTKGQPAAPATADSAIGMGTGADKIAAASPLIDSSDDNVAVEVNADGAPHEPTTNDTTPEDAMRPDVASPSTESVGETSQADTKTSTDTK